MKKMKVWGKRNKIWTGLVLGLSFLSLFILSIQTFWRLPQIYEDIFYYGDFLISAIFFCDFLIQFFTAKSKLAYMKFGWLDLISSIPLIPEFRLARAARISKLIKVFRGAKASKHLLGYFFANRANSALFAVILGSAVILLYSVVAVVTTDPTMTPYDAFWWCLFTLITGEYGEYYPPTTEGRVLAAVLMTAGVATFGTFTASVATNLLSNDQKEDERRDRETLDAISKLSAEILEIRKTINHKGD